MANIVSLDIEKKVNNKFIQLIKSDEYPIEIKEGINNVLQIIHDEKSITDLYPDILAEIPISQSQFQDQCVQYEQHYTSHKKLRQAIMEMNDRLEALYAAKTTQKKAIVKVERLKLEIEDLQKEEINKYNELDIVEKEIDLEEALRGLKNSSHLIKDAMIKVVHQQSLVKRYEEEVRSSGLSYEEAEFVYYVMYFTSEAEKQLRTGDHQIDRGTFGAISQTPEPIRLKILWNISFLKEKLFNQDPAKRWPENGDYLFKVFRNILEPKFTAPGEIEGLSIKDFYSVDTIKLLSK